MRSRLLAVAFLALTVAGCASSSTDQGSAPLTHAYALDPLPFLPPVELLCRTEDPLSQAQEKAQGNCGAFGEPVMEIAGDGSVWASATCCVGRSPPIWVSRDGGRTFAQLPFADRTGVLRDAFGVEGDFAIDDAGNVFFFDISAATTYFSEYRQDGTHVRTKPDVFPPLVDRPWVRAAKAEEAWAFYNTGSATNLFHSTDGGLTWSLQPTTFNCGLMTIGQGPARDRLFVAGCTDPTLWVSKDGGASFSSPISLPKPDLPASAGVMDPFMPPVSDSAGTIYVPFVYAMDADAKQRGIYLDVVKADGAILGPTLISGGGWNEKPWGAAAGPGQFAVAWYHADATSDQPSAAVWYLNTTYSLDADKAGATFVSQHADNVSVLKGDFGRQLGDFLQSDIGPDGRYFVIYAQRHDDGTIVNKVVATDKAVFGPGVPANGPLAT